MASAKETSRRAVSAVGVVRTELFEFKGEQRIKRSLTANRVLALKPAIKSPEEKRPKTGREVADASWAAPEGEAALMTNSFSPAPAEVAYTFMTDSHSLSATQRAELRRQGVPNSAIDHDPGHEGGPIRAARVVFEQGFFDFASEDGPEATLAYVSVARDWRGYASDIVAFDLAGRVIAAWLGREALLGAHQGAFAPRFDEPLQVLKNPDIGGWLPQQPGRSSDLGLDPRSCCARVRNPRSRQCRLRQATSPAPTRSRDLRSSCAAGPRWQHERVSSPSRKPSAPLNVRHGFRFHGSLQLSRTETRNIWSRG